MMEVSGSRSSGRICCVPGCKSGFYRKNGWQNSLFRFPKDKQMRVKWLNKIKRKDFKITKHSRVCSLHFIADYIAKKFGFRSQNTEKCHFPTEIDEYDAVVECT